MSELGQQYVLANAERAAMELLSDRVADGTLTAGAAEAMMHPGFNVTVSILTGLRVREGLGEADIASRFQARLDEARSTGDRRATVAAEFALAVWNGMQADLAAFAVAAQEEK